jgi:ribosome production factor 2
VGVPVQLLLRQFIIKFKKSGTRTPRVELSEMGPRLDLSVRRHRVPPGDVEKEAMKVAQVGKKKVRS